MSQQLIKSGFIVLSILVGGSCQPVFREDDELMFFATSEEAHAEIQECVDDCLEAVSRGDIDGSYSVDDYRVVPATLEGEIIRCDVDGSKFRMHLKGAIDGCLFDAASSSDEFPNLSNPLGGRGA